jgi:hypothetical protein
VSLSETDKHLTAGLAEQLLQETAKLGWRLDRLRVLGGGLEFVVFGAAVPALGTIALRVPRARSLDNENDPHVDALGLLEQEAALLRYGAARGLLAPAVHTLHRGEHCDFLATELVSTDDSTVGTREVGRLAGELHLLDPPAIPLIADPADSIPATLAERLARRARVVERLAGITLALPAAEELSALLEWPAAERRLLHMDLRAENVLARKGRVTALVDWSNALLGDPELELARIAEYHGLDDEFVAGYEERRPHPARAPELVALAYRLDTAVMLAVVFLSEAPDERRAVAQVTRVIRLAQDLRARL